MLSSLVLVSHPRELSSREKQVGNITSRWGPHALCSDQGDFSVFTNCPYGASLTCLVMLLFNKKTVLMSPSSRCFLKGTALCLFFLSQAHFSFQEENQNVSFLVVHSLLGPWKSALTPTTALRWGWRRSPRGFLAAESNRPL